MKKLVFAAMMILATGLAPAMTAEAKVDVTITPHGDVTVAVNDDGTNRTFVNGTELLPGCDEVHAGNCQEIGNRITVWTHDVENSVGLNGRTEQSVSVDFTAGANVVVKVKEDALRSVDINGNAVAAGDSVGWTDPTTKGHLTVTNGYGKAVEVKTASKKKSSFSDIDSSSQYWDTVQAINQRGGWKGLTENHGWTWDGQKFVKNHETGNYLDIFSLSGIRSNAASPSGYLSKRDCDRLLRNVFGGRKYVPRGSLNGAVTEIWLGKTLNKIAKRRGATMRFDAKKLRTRKLMKLEAAGMIKACFKYNKM